MELTRFTAAAAAPADTAAVAGAEKSAAATATPLVSLVAENPASGVAPETPSPERSDGTPVCNGRATAAAAPAAVALAVAAVATAAAALCLFRFRTSFGLCVTTLAVIRQGLWPQGAYNRCRFFRTSPSRPLRPVNNNANKAKAFIKHLDCWAVSCPQDGPKKSQPCPGGA